MIPGEEFYNFKKIMSRKILALLKLIDIQGLFK
jgi:hypothetical protein